MSIVTEVTPSTLSQYGIEQRPPEEKSNELGQDEFLKLMMTQLKHQDPMKPMQNGEFIGQMAQFSTVSGIEQMQKALEDLSSAYGSSQTLQSSELVGRDVLVESRDFTIGEGSETASGRFELDASSGDVRVEIIDARGSLVRSYPLGQKSSGMHDFSWDGRDEDGRMVSPGDYTVSVTAASGDERIGLNVLAERRVDSVEFAPGGNVTLNTAGGQSLSLADIRQIKGRDES